MTIRALSVWLAIFAGTWAASLTVAGQPMPPAIPNLAGQILTVNGPIEPSRLGHTLMHEHLFIDFTVPDDEPVRWQQAGRTKPVASTAVRLYNAPLTLDILGSVALGAYNRDNWTLNDEKLAITEAAEFKRHGGGTIVDVTSIGLERRPEALQRVAHATGLNIVMGAGWYTQGWHPVGLDQRSIESLTEEIVRDITIGAEDTSVRSGIIGEIGTSRDPLEPTENRIIRAAGRASRLTGAAITLHTLGLFKQHGRVLDILAAEGADLSRVILGHSDFLAGDVPYIEALMRRGATVQFDLLGKPPLVTRTRATDAEVAKTIVDLINSGHATQILLSQDICTKTSLKAYGGTGYSFIEEAFLPYLKEQGVSDQQIQTMVVDNPARLLTFVAPQPPVVVSQQ